MEEFRKYSAREVADILKDIDSALIMCHVSPDGDAVGSALALAKILRKMGKDSRVCAPSPVPRFLDFLKKDEDFSYYDGDEDDYETVITVDVASPSQLGDASENIADITDIMIDHHASGEPFADNLIKPDAAASGEIIAEIYEYLVSDGVIEKDPSVCEALYAAISADTGSFKYSNTTPHTLRCAASLMEEIDSSDSVLHADAISRLLHDTVTESDMNVNLLVTSSMKKYEEGRLVGAIITSAKIKAAGLTDGDLGGAVDIPRKMEGVLVAFVLKQSSSDPTAYKLSVRANEEIDVAEVCSLFGGGGHVRAAGATVRASTPGKALEMAVAALSEAVRDYIAKNNGEK